jgi:hypothetical protein
VCPVNQGIPVHYLWGMRQKRHIQALSNVSFMYNAEGKRRGHLRDIDISLTKKGFQLGGIKDARNKSDFF